MFRAVVALQQLHVLDFDRALRAAKGRRLVAELRRMLPLRGQLLLDLDPQLLVEVLVGGVAQEVGRVDEGVLAGAHGAGDGALRLLAFLV